MKDLNVCLKELTYAKSDLLKMTGHIDAALEAAEGERGIIRTKKNTIDGALYRAILLQKELNNILKEIEATATFQ